MLAIARQRAPGAYLLEGTATQLPLEDATFDRALSVQVLEYVADVDGALAELRRVLRPGGRLLLWDIDWSTLSWHSRDAERMARMLAAWDRHLADPVLPRTLAAALRHAGFTDVQRHAHVFDTTAMDPETFGGNLPMMIRRYVSGLEDVDQDDATAWLAELSERDARGEYSFAFTQSASPPRAGATPVPSRQHTGARDTARVGRPAGGDSRRRARAGSRRRHRRCARAYVRSSTATAAGAARSAPGHSSISPTPPSPASSRELEVDEAVHAACSIRGGGCRRPRRGAM